MDTGEWYVVVMGLPLGFIAVWLLMGGRKNKAARDEGVGQSPPAVVPDGSLPASKPGGDTHTSGEEHVPH